MLSQEEEYKLDTFSAIIKTAKNAGGFPRLGAYDIEWLAKKVKELNDELSQVTAELQKTNKELADVYETYGP